MKEKPVQPLDRNAPATAIRQRLHILYLLNDLLHHVKFHVEDSDARAGLLDGLRPRLSDIIPQMPPDGKNRVRQRLRDLLELWEQEGFFPGQTIKALHEENTQSGQGAESSDITHEAGPNLTRQLPYIMPAHHGDPSTPYYDLPAANLMPHIVPNKSISMRPDQIRALQLSAGPADESLINAVKDFLKDVERMENPYQTFEKEGIDVDMDEIGNFSYRNETDELVGDTYYGWSRAFCEKMKRRRQEDGDVSQRGRPDSISRGRSSSRSPSRSRSRSRSRSLPKRRRYDHSRSRSRSQSRPTFRSGADSRPFPQDPTDARSTFQLSLSAQSQSRPPASASPMTSLAMQQLPFIPPPSLGPGGLHFLPPRPPNYEGVWPPPPPPIPGEFSSVPFVPTPHFYPGSHQTPHSRRNDSGR